MAVEKAEALDADEPKDASDGNAAGSYIEKLRLWGATLWQVTRSRWFRIAGMVVLISLPLLLGFVYRQISSLPSSIAIANGPEGGFYEVITKRLSDEIEIQTGNRVDVTQVRTDGSLTNLRLLHEGQVDFALYQAGTEEVVNGLESCFVSRDTNGDEMLTFEEFTAPFPHDVFSDLDNNADNSLTRDEYMAPYLGERKPDIRRGRVAFRRLDTSDDGVLSIDEYNSTSSISFVANIASEAMHIIVSREGSITSMEDLQGKKVALGPRDSGNFAASLIVLEHCGLAQRDPEIGWKCPSFDAVDNLNYLQIEAGLRSGKLDAAFVNASTQSPVLRRLLGSGECRLLPVPHAEALSARNLLVSPFKIPEGIYHSVHDPSAFVPSADVESIALKAQLLTRTDVHDGLVARVIHIVLEEEFEKEGKLSELFVVSDSERRVIACQRPEFPIHDGALAVFRPRGLDYYRFEKWHALYSLIASACVAAFVGYRWIRRQKTKSRVAKLERYVDAIFAIERRQLELDVKPSSNDVDELRRLLDRVTLLRQRALQEFASHEVIEDPAVYCFVEICHYVSVKLDAKISRQRLDNRFDELAGSAEHEDVMTRKAKKPVKRKTTTSRNKKA